MQADGHPAHEGVFNGFTHQPSVDLLDELPKRFVFEQMKDLPCGWADYAEIVRYRLRLSKTPAARCHRVVVVDQCLGRLPDIEPLLHASTSGERQSLSPQG